MTLSFTVEPDPRAFEQRTQAFFAADPVRHTLPLTVLYAFARGAYEAGLLACTERAGEVVAVGVQTPPHNLIVAAADLPALEALAVGLDGHGATFPGVSGLAPWVHAFAASWAARRGLEARVTMRQRLFRLDAVLAPRPAAGVPRLAVAGDLDLLATWFAAFSEEAHAPLGSAPRQAVLRRLERQLLWVWQDGEARTSFLGRSPIVGQHARIGPVYTPPEYRGRGYASNLVAHVSADILREGVPVLFTDLANPSSNAIYQAIGYRPVSDAAMVDFCAPTQPAGPGGAAREPTRTVGARLEGPVRCATLAGRRRQTGAVIGGGEDAPLVVTPPSSQQPIHGCVRGFGAGLREQCDICGH